MFPLGLCLAAFPARIIAFPPRAPAAAQEAAEQEDEAAWVVAAKTGARSAQHALYLLHFRRVHARVARLLGHGGEADDVVQDAFVVAFRDLKQLKNAERFGPWLCGIALHQVHRRLRRRQLLRRLGLDRGAEPQLLLEALDPAAGPFVVAMLRQVQTALLQLPPVQRSAWMLRHVEGEALDVIAAQCGISLATVKRHIAKTEAHLLRHLNFEAAPEESR